MDPNVFRKGKAPSVLVVERTWDEVLDKPYQFDEMAERVIEMMEGAKDFGLLTKPDSLGRLKESVWKALLDPLKKDFPEGEQAIPHDGYILGDAFWDEIPGVKKSLREALSRLSKMMEKIEANNDNRLTPKSTLMEAKELMNETVLKPLKGVDDYA